MLLFKSRTRVLLAYRVDIGRIPEGHRKGNKDIVKVHSGCICKRICISEGYRKDAERVLEEKVLVLLIGIELLL